MTRWAGPPRCGNRLGQGRQPRQADGHVRLQPVPDEAERVTEQRLDYQGEYLTTYTFYDGLLRSRETQGRAVGRPQGKVVSETLYDTAGRAWKSYTPYFTDGAPSAELVTAADNQVPAGMRHDYDGVGRTVLSVALRYGDEEARTRTVYDGAERTTVIPPEGGTATTTITDAFGRKVEQRSYTNAGRTAYQARPTATIRPGTW